MDINDLTGELREIAESQLVVKRRSDIYAADAKELAARLLGLSENHFYDYPWSKWKEIDRAIQTFTNMGSAAFNLGKNDIPEFKGMTGTNCTNGEVWTAYRAYCKRTGTKTGLEDIK
jgi:hypothetical protein